MFKVTKFLFVGLSIFMIAKSVNGSNATTEASYSFQSFVIIVYFAVVSATTCLFVIIIPSFETKKPLQPQICFSTLQIFS